MLGLKRIRCSQEQTLRTVSSPVDTRLGAKEEERKQKKKSGDAEDGKAGSSHAGVPAEVSEDLVNGVASMAVDGRTSDPNARSVKSGLGRVSGLDSFAGSSEGKRSDMMETDEHLSMHDRLLARSARLRMHAETREDVGDTLGVDGAAQHGASPAKCSKLSTSSQKTLTGAQDEPRQAS